jgi:hypothetical protein
VQVRSSSDSSKRRESAVSYFSVPVNVCGESTTPPSVTTRTPRSVRADQALFEASIIPGGAPTTYVFEYGTTPGYGQTTLGVLLPAGVDSIRVGQIISQLDCETTYHYRAVAQNFFGTLQGLDTAFTTGECLPGTPIFADGFESGTAGAWSGVVS